MDGKSSKRVPLLAIIVASLMSISGIGENIVVILSNANKSSPSITLYFLGFSYIFGGILIYFFRKWSLILALLLLSGNITLRIVMLFTGIYPTSTAIEVFGYIFGISLAFLFLGYVLFQIKKIKQNIT
jgi:hypothetical protein